jgi:predicted esterase
MKLALVLTVALCGGACARAERPGARRDARESSAVPAPSVTSTTPASPRAASAAPPLAPAEPSAQAPVWPPTPPGATSDFCIETVEVLDESACYVLPEAPSEELLIYLHGIVPPSKDSRQKTNFERVVSAASRRAGVAALMPRGRVGLAPRGHDGWWGWPTSRLAYREHAEALVGELAEKRSKLERLIGRPFRRVYLAGSSSGAYFVTALALQGALPASGYGIISGAADRPDVDLTALPRSPFYIGFGTRDTVGDAARALGKRLERAGFPVVVAAHPLPHGTAEVYLDEAFAHFRAHAR